MESINVRSKAGTFFLGPKFVEVRSTPNDNGILPGVLPPAYANSRTSIGVFEALSISPIYRSIDIINNYVAGMTLVVKKGSDVQALPTLVSQPDVNSTQYQFIKGTVTSLALTADAYWLVSRRASDDVVNNLEVLNPLAVQVSLNDSGRKTFSYNGKTYTERSIVHLRTFEVPGRVDGLSVIEAGAQGFLGTVALRAYADNWFGNTGSPKGGYLKSTNDLDSDELAAARNAWQSQMNDGLPPAMGNNFDWQSVNLDPSQALFTEQQQFAVTEVARWFGIPSQMLLASVDGNSMTYSNLQTDLRLFVQSTLATYMYPIAEAFTNLLPRGTVVEFDTSTLLKADTETRWAALNGASFMTVNEKRAMEGLAPIEGGDTLSTPTTQEAPAQAGTQN